VSFFIVAIYLIWVYFRNKNNEKGGSKMKVCLFFLIIGVLVFSGCASTAPNLQRETARFIGDIHPDQVTVYDIKRGATNVKWEADTPKGKYSCSADDMVRRVYCVKK